MTMKKILKSTVAFVTLCGIAFAFVGCNTMGGVGRDLEEAGEEIQEEAN
jgi:predicted small secreted protein